MYCVLYVLYTVYKCPCTLSFSNACLSFSSGDLSESLHSLYCSVCHLLGVGQRVCLSIKLPVLSGVPGTRVYAPLELINIHLIIFLIRCARYPGVCPAGVDQYIKLSFLSGVPGIRCARYPVLAPPPPPEWNKELVYPFNLSVLSGVLGTRISLTYLSYAVCQVPGCMPRLSGSRSHATTGSRPPSGPWASCCMTWSAGTSPSRVTSRSVSPTSGRERRERERESETTKNERNS